MSRFISRGAARVSLFLLVLAPAAARAEVTYDVGFQASMEIATRGPDISVGFPRTGTVGVTTSESNDADAFGAAAIIPLRIAQTVFVGTRATGRVQWDGAERIGAATTTAQAFGCLGLINNTPVDQVVDVKIDVWQSPIGIEGTVGSVIQGRPAVTESEYARTRARLTFFSDLRGGPLASSVMLDERNSRQPGLENGWDIVALPFTVTEQIVVPGYTDISEFVVHEVCIHAQAEGLGVSLFDGTEGRELIVDDPVVAAPLPVFSAKELARALVPFLEEAVAAGLVQQSGGAWPRLRPPLLSWRLRRIEQYVDAERPQAACPLIDDTARRTDGAPEPSDWVVGPLTAELHDRLLELHRALRCPTP